MKVTTDNLNDVMEFDRVIEVRADGTVTVRSDLYAPELFDGELQDDGWTLMNGYTGQYGYNGPMLHASEHIGGGLARDILATPGLYVALVDTPDSADDTEPEGWAVAFRPAPTDSPENR
jgi:hypothetical protein